MNKKQVLDYVKHEYEQVKKNVKNYKEWTLAIGEIENAKTRAYGAVLCFALCNLKSKIDQEWDNIWNEKFNKLLEEI